MRKIYFLSLNMIQFVPYAYGLLRCYAEQSRVIRDHYAWQEPFCRLEPVASLVSKITRPDLLFLSCYAWNFNQQIEVARQVKTRYPQCRVVCGGPHIPHDSTGYLETYPFIDILVHGEGEIPVRNLLEELLQAEPNLAQVKGISYRHDNKTIQTAVSEKLPKDLPVPSPYLQSLFTSFLTSADKANKIALWETNRGCPFSCCFCDWGVRTTNKVRLHQMDRVQAEVDYFGRHKIEDIYITDSNFGLFERDLEIARLLATCKEKYGYPQRVRIQFAKKTNRTVLEISRLLFEHNMLWGTTLSMQSVDMTVLEAIKRPKVSLAEYKSAKEQYQAYRIPTYTELILGLPRETRKSFIKGICTLFEIEMHDDFRTFELVLLPNAPLAQPAMREKYGLQTRRKPMRIADDGCQTEYVELVFATNTMSLTDWEDCFVFSEMAQALHNGGYTRFLAIYLHRTGQMTYYDFYTALFDWMLSSAKPTLQALSRIRRLIHDFYEDPEMPQINRALTQPDITEFLASFNPDRKGWQLWTYIWLWLADHRPEFYRLLRTFLARQAIGVTGEMEDLLRYQEEIMLSQDYDPAVGKSVAYQYDWPAYFNRGAPLVQQAVRLHYQDVHMGASYQYDLAPNDRKKYVTAAIGFSYPYSKFRHFFHQPATAKIEIAG